MRVKAQLQGKRLAAIPDARIQTVVIYVASLGLCEYRRALQVQYAVHAHCLSSGHNALLLTEHLPVITLGYRRLPGHLRLPSSFLAERGIMVVATERGGGATYHGPGQLVAYPIFSSLLRRYGVRQFVAGLEEVMCRVSQGFGAPAVPRPGLPGVWVGAKKLGSVGIAVRRGVSLHGCALNVDLDLQPFSYIIPCGLNNVNVTSLGRETGATITMPEAAACMRREFAAVFSVTLQEMPNEWHSVE